MIRRRFPVAVHVAAVVIVAVTTGSCGGSTPPPPPPVSVTIDGTPHDLPAGSTFGEALARFDAHAVDGRLLSVSGGVLDAHADEGVVLLNGSRSARSQPLHAGDDILVVNGKTQIERTRRITIVLPRPVPADPQRTLARYPTREITVEGRSSGEIASVRTTTEGRGVTPNAVALTFDDGPWPVHTERILAILHRLRVQATFFMVGLQVERYPDLVRRVEAAGNLIGNHSFDHPINPSFADLTEHHITAELADTNDALSTDGVVASLFRPPGGSYDEYVVDESRRQGMRVVLWSVDPQDWRQSRTAKDITKKVLKNVRPGSIILLHDGGGDAEHTIRALPDIIKGIRKKGLRFTTVQP
jgi:peptidoglycan-N-acetylglucosamine deacetylase